MVRLLSPAYFLNSTTQSTYTRRLHSSARLLSSITKINMQQIATADLCDDHMSSPERLKVVEPGLFRMYGKKKNFHGPIETVKCFESNPLVRETLSSPGGGRVLVVDGGGSKRCAIMGDMLARFGAENGWNGVVINGYIRDSKIINGIDIGVKALGTHPLKSLKAYRGEKGVQVNFGGGA
uniref:4-hydroxy-4-methyl-2-oxoglutarate aldolase n=1 Tax=Chaetoceros debilis TaxID=122233 RepID=A0A7S3PVW3_9STRA